MAWHMGHKMVRFQPMELFISLLDVVKSFHFVSVEAGNSGRPHPSGNDVQESPFSQDFHMWYRYRIGMCYRQLLCYMAELYVYIYIYIYIFVHIYISVYVYIYDYIYL